MFEREPIYTEDVRLLERVSKLVGRSWICRALRFGELMVEIEKKIIEENEENRYICSICGEDRFTKFQQLNSHMNMHRHRKTKKIRKDSEASSGHNFHSKSNSQHSTAS